tara:strand:- start:3188 stop:3412 length:225 start_codon:yes stop_codon:yes gene_type:complete
MKYVNKLFEERDSWETAEILDRLISGISPRYVPTKTQLHRVLLKDHYNVNSRDSNTLALWKKKVQKEKLVEVIE